MSQPPSTTSTDSDTDSRPNIRCTTSATQVCHASREKIWQCLVDKIRHPEKYVGPRKVSIIEDTADYVIRHMQIGAEMTIKEKITWDESTWLVRYTTIDDETKFGHVENTIGNEVSDHKGKGFEVTYAFDWTFTDKAPQGQGEEMKSKIHSYAKSALDMTIPVIESQ